MNASVSVTDPHPSYSVTAIPSTMECRCNLRTSPLRRQLTELDRVLARIESKGAVIRSIHLEHRAQPLVRLNTNHFCRRLGGHRCAFGHDRHGPWERWEARIGSIQLLWELRGRTLVTR